MCTSFRPIETLIRWTNNAAPTACCKDFLLIFPQTVKGFFLPKITLPDPSAEVVVIFSGQALGFQNFGGMSVRTAREVLDTEYGISPRTYAKAA